MGDLPSRMSEITDDDLGAMGGNSIAAQIANALSRPSVRPSVRPSPSSPTRTLSGGSQFSANGSIHHGSIDDSPSSPSSAAASSPAARKLGAAGAGSSLQSSFKNLLSSARSFTIGPAKPTRTQLRK